LARSPPGLMVVGVPPAGDSATPIPHTLGALLERTRLEHRAARLESVLSALHARARDYAEAEGTLPASLRLAMADFDGELRAVRRRLLHAHRA
jgi:hypothetical protein